MVRGQAAPGRAIRLAAVISNSADVPQRVALYLADLRLTKDGTPQLGEPHEGIGAWGRFDEPSIVVPAKGERTVTFTATVPADADPGDHLGAVVAEGAPTGSGAVGLIRRVASRLYVTVPGAARARLQVVSATVSPERAVAPRWGRVTVLVRNTGTVRLQPTVRVGGVVAHGSPLLMSRSDERYVARVRMPVLGGPASFRAVARGVAANGGAAESSRRASTFVLPIAPLLFLALLVLGVLTTRRLARLLRR